MPALQPADQVAGPGRRQPHCVLVPRLSARRVTGRRRIDFEAARRDWPAAASAAARATATCTGTWRRSRRGVPFEQQQLAALDTDWGLDLSEEKLDELAAEILAALAETGKEPPGA